MDANPTTERFPSETDASGIATATKVRNVHPPKGWRKDFLRYLRKDGNVNRAAKLAGVSDRHVRRTRSKSSRFSAAYDQARKDARRAIVSKLEASTLHLALHGQKVPVVSNGQVITHKRQRFPQLMMGLLEANAPGKYGRKVSHQHTTNVLVSLEARQRFFKDPDYRKAICDRDTSTEPPRGLGSNGGDPSVIDVTPAS